MKQIRRIHGWLGVLFAPAILLFVISGMFQMGGCHEGEDGEEPSALVVRLAQLHMKQTVSMPRARPPRPTPPPAAATPAPAPAPEAARAPEGGGGQHRSTLPLKLFFFAMGFSLIASTVLGLWIAFTSKRDQKLHVGLLAAGIVLPILLMFV